MASNTTTVEVLRVGEEARATIKGLGDETAKTNQHLGELATRTSAIAVSRGPASVPENRPNVSPAAPIVSGNQVNVSGNDPRWGAPITAPDERRWLMQHGGAGGPWTREEVDAGRRMPMESGSFRFVRPETPPQTISAETISAETIAQQHTLSRPPVGPSPASEPAGGGSEAPLRPLQPPNLRSAQPDASEIEADGAAHLTVPQLDVVPPVGPADPAETPADTSARLTDEAHAAGRYTPEPLTYTSTPADATARFSTSNEVPKQAMGPPAPRFHDLSDEDITARLAKTEAAKFVLEEALGRFKSTTAARADKVAGAQGERTQPRDEAGRYGSFGAMSPDYRALIDERDDLQAERARRGPTRPASTLPGSVTPDELDALHRTFTDEEIAASTSLGPGRRLFQQAGRDTPGGGGDPGVGMRRLSAAEAASPMGRPTMPPGGPPGGGGPGGDDPERNERDARNWTQTDQGLIRSIKEHRAALVDLHDETTRAGSAQEKLTAESLAGKDVTEDLAAATEHHTQAQMRRASTTEDLHAMEAEARARGLNISGGGGIGQQAAGGFLGGMGIGGGSPLGVAAGAVLYGANPYVAAATLAGMAAGYSLQQSGEYVDEQRETYDASMSMGPGSAPGIRERATERRSGPEWIHYKESVDAETALAHATGSPNADPELAFSRAYGLPTGPTTSQFAGLSRLGWSPRTVTGVRGEPEPIPQSAHHLALTAPAPAPTPENATADSIGESIHRYGLGVALARQLYPPQPGSVAEAQDRADRGEPPAADLVRMGPDTRSAGLPGAIAGAYERSAYAGGVGVDPKYQDALAGAFTTGTMDVIGAMATGGRPVTDDVGARGAELLSSATNLYGKDVPPEIPAQVAASYVRSVQQPGTPMMEGIENRAIMRLGDDPVARAKLLKTGYDPSTITGAIALRENATTFDAAHGGRELHDAMQAGRAEVVGEPGSQFDLLSRTGPMAQRINEAKIAAQPWREPGTPVDQATLDAKTVGKRATTTTEQGPEKVAIELEAAKSQIGEQFKQLGQSVLTDVLELLAKVTAGHAAWNAHTAAP